VSDKAQRTVRIKWIRSGIGFDHHQKRIVRSLGLGKLNQEVERPDTPQIRGLVAKVPHLVKIVEASKQAAWTLVPEYTIYPPAAAPAERVETAPESPAVETEKPEAPISAPSADAGAVREPPLPSAEAAGDTATEKSGIERHAEIAGSAQEESKPEE